MINIGFEMNEVHSRKFSALWSGVTTTRTSFLRDAKEVNQSSKNIVYLDKTLI